MRISTNTMFETGSARLTDLAAGMHKTQQQLATNRRILTPSDDPVAAAQALVITQAQSVNAQYAINRQNAKDSLNQEENALSNSISLLRDARTLIVAAGNTPTYNNADRATIADQLGASLEQLVSYANTNDGKGNYLFSGYQTDLQPYTVQGTLYNGDQGQRMAQVGAGRQVAISDPGENVFSTVTSVTIGVAAAAANTGAGGISAPSVTDPTAITGHTYNVVISGGATVFSVYDMTVDPMMLGAPRLTGAYPPATPVAFDGMQFTLSAGALDGDVFSATPQNTHQSVFTTLSTIIAALRTPGTAGLSAAVSTALGNLDLGLNQIDTARSSVGSRLAEVDSLDSAGMDRDLQYSTTLSALQDLDYAKAISEFTQQQQTLLAAQKSFMTISDLSLFKIL